MEKSVKAIIKLNNIIGFLPPNLSQIITAVINELKELFPNYEAKVCLDDLSHERKELFWLSHRGLVVTHKNCQVMKEGLPLIVSNTEAESGCQHCCHTDCTATYICLPIVAGKEVLGSISMHSETVNPLTRDEMEILVAIVNQAGFAIQRNRLIRGLQKEKAALEQANQEVSQLNRELTTLVEHLQTTQAQLIRSEKLAAAGRLAANMAHEINNPTGIILSRLDCIFLDRETEPRLLKDLQVIQRQAQRIANITRGVLSFTRQENDRTKDKSLIDLGKLVQETCSWLENQFTKQGITLQLHLDSIPMVEGSFEQMHHVLINLLINARDAMPEGGIITVNLRRDSDDKISLEVADTGLGIPLEEQDKIFEPFYTSKEPGEGTGLGLFIAYSIVKQHQGDITVKSVQGQGTKFKIELPITLRINKKKELLIH